MSLCVACWEIFYSWRCKYECMCCQSQLWLEVIWNGVFWTFKTDEISAKRRSLSPLLQWRSRAKAASFPALASAPASLFMPVVLTHAVLASTPAKMAPCWLCCRPVTTEASPICSSPLTATTCIPAGARWTQMHSSMQREDLRLITLHQ